MGENITIIVIQNKIFKCQYVRIQFRCAYESWYEHLSLTHTMMLHPLICEYVKYHNDNDKWKNKKKYLAEIERLYRSRSKIMMIYIMQRLTLNLRDKSFTKFSYILILKKIWNRNQKLMTTRVRAQHKHRVFMNRTRRSAVLPYGQ